MYYKNVIFGGSVSLGSIRGRDFMTVTAPQARLLHGLS